MSQSSSPPSAGGKAVKERRRASVEQPYKRQTRQAMPTTRHSPTRAAQPTPAGQADQGQVSLANIMQEFVLLRQSMEAKFGEAGKKTDSLRNEVVSKLDANDQAVSELQLAVTDVTLSVDKNQRAIHEVRAKVERREVELPEKVRAIVQEVLDGQSARRRPGPTPSPALGIGPSTTSLPLGTIETYLRQMTGPGRPTTELGGVLGSGLSPGAATCTRRRWIFLLPN